MESWLVEMEIDVDKSYKVHLQSIRFIFISREDIGMKDKSDDLSQYYSHNEPRNYNYHIESIYYN